MARVLPEDETEEMKEDMDEKESAEADVALLAGGGEREVAIVDVEAERVRRGAEGAVRVAAAAAGANVVAAGDVAVGHHIENIPRHVRSSSLTC